MKKPSVTQLIKLLDKPALVKWANDLGLKGMSLEEKYKQNTSKGISSHEEIYCRVVNNEILWNEETEANYQRFIANREIIDLEKDIETDYFVGRYDVKIKSKGIIGVFDFKPKAKDDKVYFEQVLQLAAYQMAVPECKFVGIVNYPEFRINLIQADLKPFQDILISLSQIHQLKQLADFKVQAL